MFSSSVRRVVFPVPLRSVTTSATSIVSRVTYGRSHRRRSSSSKPSSPADGSKGISEVPGSAAHKASGRSSRRKSKDVAANRDNRDEALRYLPSVPSTHHVNDSEIAASAFFSLYRPISVTSSFPKAITEGAFAAIFTPRTKLNSKSSAVFSTLSSTVHRLEAATQQECWNAETDELRAAITAESGQLPVESEIHHLDAAPSDSIPFPRHILPREYRPFRAPPPPEPMKSEESLPAGAEAALETQVPQHRTYKAVLTIEESTDANGSVTYMAHSSPLIADIEEPESSSSAIRNPNIKGQPTRYRERMNIRQERYEESLNRKEEQPAVWAISVKRQRKLKMKKHKYKKLMRRTRNLRRRLDRN